MKKRKKHSIYKRAYVGALKAGNSKASKWSFSIIAGGLLMYFAVNKEIKGLIYDIAVDAISKNEEVKKVATFGTNLDEFNREKAQFSTDLRTLQTTVVDLKELTGRLDERTKRR